MRSIKITQRVQIFLLIVGFILSLFSAQRFYKNSYNSDLSFLAELAGNRGLFDKSVIWIEGTVDENLIQYYCEQPRWNANSAYENEKCKLNSEDINGPVEKELYIGSQSYIDKVQSSPIYSATPISLDRGSYSILMYEFK